MASDAADRQPPDRRDFLKTAGTLTAGAVMYQGLDGLARPLLASSDAAVPARWLVRPFALNQVVFAHIRDGKATEIWEVADVGVLLREET